MKAGFSGCRADARSGYGTDGVPYTPAGVTRSSSPREIREIKGVVFDLGGVVVDWDNATAYKAIQERYGISVDVSKKLLEGRIKNVQTGELDERMWLGEFFLSELGRLPEGYERVWEDTFDEGYRVNERVIGILKRLRKNRYKLAVLSNIEPSHALVDRRKGTAGLFDATVYSCEVGMRKPDPRIFALAAESLRLKAGECLFIDDVQEYTDAAEVAGMVGIVFKDAGQLVDDLNGNGVTV